VVVVVVVVVVIMPFRFQPAASPKRSNFPGRTEPPKQHQLLSENTKKVKISSMELFLYCCLDFSFLPI